jgi:hypothetical protein
MRLRPLTILTLLAVAVALGACGNKTSGNKNAAGSAGADPATTGGQAEAIPEGQYADIGGLKYQVQLSRELNPADAEDHGNLVGVPGADAPGAANTWFGVWMRVQYDRKSGRPLPTARDFVMSDTQGNQWRPVAIATDNLFAYRPTTLNPTDILPTAGSAAAESTIQGALLLFKVPFEDLQNRPLVLTVTDPQTRRPTELGLDV